MNIVQLMLKISTGTKHKQLPDILIQFVELKFVANTHT